MPQTQKENIRNLVMPALAYENVASVTDKRIKLVKTFDVARIYNALSRNFNQKRV